MKKLIILLTITISSISLSKAQPEIKIDMDGLQTDISSELATLSVDLSNMHLDLEGMKNEINANLVNLDNISNSLDLSNITVSSTHPGISIEVSDSNTANSYAYVYTPGEPSNSQESFTYSYTTTETPQNNDIFKQLSNTKGIQVVYISKTMLGMMPNMDMPGVDIGNIAGKLESLEIYSSEETSASRRLIYVSEDLLKGGNYETLMLIKDNDSRTAFYVKKNKSNQGSEMLMITEDGSDATIIRFLGSFTVQDIKNIANQSKNGVHINTSINTNTSNRLSEAELNMRIKEAQKRNEQAQKIAIDAQKRAEEAQKRAEERAKNGQQKAEEAQIKAEERAKRAEERARRAEERAKEAEERARKAN
ncbi:DUF4252 domain-containing protein [Dysgonomonas sp. HDW5A]|uniref:DUF4252 domain-containing protein n=1 Tax=Dysgonomonas sp. HDW5A TaxID=2714926 RepID=UPI00140CF8F1|nr:DUF4252 domain-containing protein [Dysgonomonas sp. HDW5A]QIK59392.1 DUF4252 domain-containing protein [Dysgonomonas sp. HDW5A]